MPSEDGSQPKRGGTAYTFEPTQLLTLNASFATRLCEALPEFARLVHVNSIAYGKLNQLNGTQAGRLARPSKEMLLPPGASAAANK